MPGDTAGPSPRHLLAVAGISAAVLAFEVLLLRLFGFSHWHHFAGLAIALALLGLGTAGTLLTLLGGRAARAGDALQVGGLVATGAGLLLVVVLHARIALRPAFAAWDTGELLRLLAVDFAAFLPFLSAGLVIGQAFARWPRHTRSVYAANLLGSGAGSIGASLALTVLQVETAIAVAAAALCVLAILAARAQRSGPAMLAGALVLAAAVAALVHPPAPLVSDFKALSRLLDLPDARVLDRQAGLPGRLTLIRSGSIREAPGLSLQWTEPVTVMDAAVIGSDRVVPLLRDYRARQPWAEATLAGLAPRLRPDSSVLVLGASAWGTPSLVDARRLTWVVADRRLAGIAAARGLQRNALVHDGLYRHLATTNRRYAVMVADAAFAGGDAASEDYVLTIEGLALALGRLRDDGLLAVPLELRYPPQHFPRVLATVAAALERRGAKRPGQHVAVLRGLQSALILASPRVVSGEDIAGIRRFAGQWRFDLAWLPGIGAQEVNRHHRLDTPAFFDIARAVLEQEPLPPIAAWFITGSADTAQPYVWRSLDWGRAREMIRALGRRGISYLDWSLVITAITAVTVTALAFVLILAPLGRLPAPGTSPGRPGVAAYFSALGLGYLLVELAVFQRTILFLGEPVTAASLVFAVFLLGSGLGSATAPQSPRRQDVHRVFLPIAASLVPVAGLWLPADPVMSLALVPRAAVLAALLLPSAWAMGRAFPWGLRQLADRSTWIPWAWGINGFASVVAASAATLVSVHHGQPVTLAAGAACYALAYLVAGRWTAEKGSRSNRAAGRG